MRIVFVGNGLLYSDKYPITNVGGSVQTWGLSRELAKRGHEVFIIRRNTANSEEIFDNVNLVGIKFKGVENVVHERFTTLPFHVASAFSSLYFSSKSLKPIQSIDPDIICLIDRFSGIFPSSLEVPKLYIMHAPEALNFFKPYTIHANKLNSIMFYVKKTLEGVIMLKADKIVVLNSFIEEHLRINGFNKVAKIPNAVDPQEFMSRGDGNYILYAGRFDWNKNVHSLIEPFAELQDTYGDYRLYLVGEGPQERRIRSLIKKKGLQSSVTIVPWLSRKKLLNITSKCSVFVLPSFFEAANPVVVLEAMASGKPVIARANMGTVDIIIHGKNGYLYNNDEELRRYMELLLSDANLRKEMGYNARKTVEDKHSFTRIANRYAEVFNGLLDRNLN